MLCAIKPFAHCEPDSSSEKPHESVLAGHHHQTDGHEHQEEHHDDAGGSDPTCAEDPTCKAIYSAVNTTSPAALEFPCATLLYEVFQLSTIVTLDSAVYESAVAKERVLLLTHEVCTCVNSFALAPPSA